MASRRANAIALIAALQGALGVALSAAAAHIQSSPVLTTAALFLMLHAGAGLALAALLRSAPFRPPWLTGASFALQAGVWLFSSDLAWRGFMGARLFPYAAPLGGSLTILSWLGLAAWAGAALFSRDGR